MTNAKKGVFQITVDLKSLQIKIAITNFVLTVTKCQFKMVFQKFKILQNIFFDKILSDPITLQFTVGPWGPSYIISNTNTPANCY